MSLFVDGAWVPGGGVPFIVSDPATGEKTWSGTGASEAQVGAAVAAARAAAQGWRSTSPQDRLAVAARFASSLGDPSTAEGLASLITGETGKPLWESRTEVGSMAAKVAISAEAMALRAGTVERAAGAATSVTRHRPHGVLAVFGPYNFPGHLPNGHIVPALLAGNCIVFKPSELAPATAEATVRLWVEAGIPPGVVNLVQGGPDVGRALSAHPGIDGILFTGSVHTGRLLHQQAARPELMLALELGGNNPLIVRPEADVDAAVSITIQSAYLSAGQRCSCARRLIVPSGAWGDGFLDRLAEAVSALEPGDPRGEPQPFLGPVVSAAAADALVAAWDRLVGLGGLPMVPLLRGEARTGFVTPGLIDVTAISDLPDEEYFGPLLQVIRHDGLDEAIAIANDTHFGLAAGLIGGDRAEFERVLDEVHAGVINWNRPTTGASSAAPFGGVGASGNHRPSAFYAADYVAYPVASLEAELPSLPDPPLPGLTIR